MIQNDTVVSLNYTLKDEDGNILDASQGQPLAYIQGHNQIIPGLEKALTGLIVGSKKQVVVNPEEAYGPHSPELCFTVDKGSFQGETPEPGMMIQLQSPEGQVFMAQVISIQEDQVDLDANHPLAGKTLYFDVEVTDLRQATPEELTHGHVHGPGGHHH